MAISVSKKKPIDVNDHSHGQHLISITPEQLHRWRLPRALDEERKIIYQHKVELKLLSTLGTKEMKRWLRGGKQRTDTFDIGQYSIVTRLHQDENQSNKLQQLANAVRTTSEAVYNVAQARKALKQFGDFNQQVDDFLKNLDQQTENLKQAVSGGIRPRQYQFGEIIDRGDCYIPLDFASPFISLYTSVEGLNSTDEAVEDLSELFGLELDSPLSDITIDGRTNWHSVRPRPTNSVPPEQLISQAWPSFQSLSNEPMSDWIEFRDRYGRCLFLVLHSESNVLPERRIILPNSEWQKAGYDRVFLLNVPPQKRPLPLLNHDLLCRNSKAPVLLVDHLPFAWHLIQNPPAAYHDHVIVSWYGDLEGARTADWEALRNRNVAFLRCQGLEPKEDPRARTRSLEHALEVKALVSSLASDFKEYVMCVDETQYQPSCSISLEDLDYLAKKYGPNVPTASKNQQRSSPSTVSCVSEVGNVQPAGPLILPAIAEKTVSLLYSEPGLGKTWMAIGLSVALAAGQKFVGKWQAPQKGRVLYIDGELGEDLLKQRVGKVVSSFGISSDNPEVNQRLFFKSLAADQIDLSETEGQNNIREMLHEIKSMPQGGKVSLLVVDNLLSLTGFSDTGKTWNGLFSWLRELRNAGMAILIVHHANRAGTQRGTDIKRAAVDNVFRLQHEPGAKENDLAMSIHIEKGRELDQIAKNSMRFCFTPGAKRPRWRQLKQQTQSERGKGQDEQRRQRIAELTEQGWSLGEIAKDLNCHRTTVARLKKRYGLSGQYTKRSDYWDQADNESEA